MNSGLGIYRKYRILYAYINLFRFWIRKSFIGFDAANHYIKRVDKVSLIKILKKNGAIIGQNCDIETGITFHNCRNYSNLHVKDNCHIGKNCFFDLQDKIKIGNNVTISMECILITHQDMGKSSLRQVYKKSQKPIFIGNNAYIGANSTILPGVTIGEESITAAGSLIKKNVEQRTIVGGVPALIIKELDNFPNTQ